MDFRPFAKIARLSREMVITEKIDGTNGIIAIEDGVMWVGSRTRWISPQDDNMGFARWAFANRDELLGLGDGFHYGEWWGLGIQRTYGLKEKRFSLFNTSRWSDPSIRPVCCDVVPVLFTGLFSTMAIDMALGDLRENGSVAAPGFMRPEGVVVFHTASGFMFKKTIEKDEFHKGEIKN